MDMQRLRLRCPERTWLVMRADRFARYLQGFKAGAVRLGWGSGKSARDTVTDLGVSALPLNRWLKDPELSGTRSTGNVGADERAELR